MKVDSEGRPAYLRDDFTQSEWRSCALWQHNQQFTQAYPSLPTSMMTSHNLLRRPIIQLVFTVASENWIVKDRPGRLLQ